MSRASELVKKVCEGAKLKLEVGDKVQYSKAWLRSTGSYTGDFPRAKGVITKLEKLGSLFLAVIDWNYPDIPSKVNVANLKKLK